MWCMGRESRGGMICGVGVLLYVGVGSKGWRGSNWVMWMIVVCW